MLLMTFSEGVVQIIDVDVAFIGIVVVAIDTDAVAAVITP